MTERASPPAHVRDDHAPLEVTRGEYVVSTDRSRIDVSLVHAFLTESYWSPGIPEDVVRRAIAGAMCFGIYRGTEQVGFARVITDRATFAYLADVFVVEAHRGRGLAKVMMEAIMSHPELQGLRRFSLSTRDAHGLYAQFGFRPVGYPDRLMEILRRDIYLEGAQR